LIIVPERSDPAFIFDQAQISRQCRPVKTEPVRQLGDGERTGLCERCQNRELRGAQTASPEMPLIVLRNGPAGTAERGTRASLASFK